MQFRRSGSLRRLLSIFYIKQILKGLRNCIIPCSGARTISTATFAAPSKPRQQKMNFLNRPTYEVFIHIYTAFACSSDVSRTEHVVAAPYIFIQRLQGAQPEFRDCP